VSVRNNKHEVDRGLQARRDTRSTWSCTNHSLRVRAEKKDAFGDKDAFCKCTKDHAAGCRLVYDLLMSDSILTISLLNKEDGTEGAPVLVGPAGNIIFNPGEA